MSITDVAGVAGDATAPDGELGEVAQILPRVVRLRARIDEHVPRPLRRHILERMPEYGNEYAASKPREEILGFVGAARLDGPQKCRSRPSRHRRRPCADEWFAAALAGASPRRDLPDAVSGRSLKPARPCRTQELMLLRSSARRSRFGQALQICQLSVAMASDEARSSQAGWRRLTPPRAAAPRARRRDSPRRGR